MKSREKKKEVANSEVDDKECPRSTSEPRLYGLKAD